MKKFSKRKNRSRKTFKPKVGKFRKSKVTNTVGHEYGPFPPRFKACLTYRENQLLALTAGAFTSYTYRLNDLYDPRYAAGGSQPRGFDTLCGAGGGSQPYSWFMVKAFKVRLTLYNSTAYSGYCGYAISCGSSNIPTSYSDIMESRFAKVRHLTKSGGCLDQISVGTYNSVSRVFGVSKAQIVDGEEYHGNYGATPADVAYITVFWYPDTGDNATIIGDLKIDYYAEFFNPNKLTQS